MSARVIVLGDGADEHVAAHYLARAGCAVTVIGRRAGGGEEALDSGWVPQPIVRDLDLERHGLKVTRLDPWASVALSGSDRLDLSYDIARTADSIRKLSARDAARWPEFCERMARLARLLESLYLAAPPDPLAEGYGNLAKLGRVGLQVRGLGRQGMEDLFRLLPMSVADLLDDWFDNDALKGALGAAGVMNLCQGPRSGGTAFNLLHHHVGSPPGVFRPALSNARAVLSRLEGPARRREPVTHLNIREGSVTGVVLENDEELAGTVVVSGIDPRRTLLDLADPGWLDPQLVRALRHVRSRGIAAKLALTLDQEPGFETLVVAPSLDYLERAYDDVKYGRVSTDPYIEARYAGPIPGGRHRVDIHVQYAPQAPWRAPWDTAMCERFAGSVIARLSDAAPRLAGSVIGRHLMTPEDLEHIEGFPQGQEYHAELALDQILWMRPVPALAQYGTPIRGLYLCGPAMHPGAGVAGAAGANAARAVLRDLRSGAIA